MSVITVQQDLQESESAELLDERSFSSPHIEVWRTLRSSSRSQSSTFDIFDNNDNSSTGQSATDSRDFLESPESNVDSIVQVQETIIKSPHSDPYGTLQFLDSLGDNYDYIQSNSQSLPDRAFVRDQLVPASYLNSTDFKMVDPDNYITYPKHQLYLTMENIVFYIEGIRDAHLPKHNLFIISVQGPNGNYIKGKIQIGLNHEFCFWTFRPVEPGMHYATVRLGSRGCHHIHGSPMSIFVARNYPKSVRSSILTFKTNVVDPDSAIKPSGIASDPVTDRIYVTDTYRNQIIVYSPEGRLVGMFGEAGNGAGEMLRPTTIAMDEANRRLIIADKDNHRICIFTLDGQFIQALGREGDSVDQFRFPWAVAVSRNGELIAVADSEIHRIQFFSKDGTFLRMHNVYPEEPQTTLNDNYPRGICFDNENKHILISDFNRRTVYILEIEFGLPRCFVDSTGILLRPQGLTVDITGNILICDSSYNCIQVFSSTGNHLYTIDGMDGKRFKGPLNLTISKKGFLIIMDNKGRIQVC